MESKSALSVGSVVGLCAVVLVLYFCMQAMGNNSKLQTGINYLQTGKTSIDFHQLARLDAQQNGISADLFEKQIQVESGFNPNAVSPAGAVGIAQFMPSTAQGLGIGPYDPVQSLSGAASLMARYYTKYQSYDKALAAYNAGSDALNTALSNCGANWRSCIPAETQHYITAIVG
jgi:soluble lytic murein transglycosylase-like protein